MATRRTNESKDLVTRRPPATTSQDRENQLISLATDLAEKQMREGTASAQVVTHYLKLGSSREQLEQVRLEHENRLTEAKIASLASQQATESLLVEALKAFRSYAGESTESEEDGYDD